MNEGGVVIGDGMEDDRLEFAGNAFHAAHRGTTGSAAEPVSTYKVQARSFPAPEKDGYSEPTWTGELRSVVVPSPS